MAVIWITKRHYTHKDAFADRFGRVYELPSAWARAGEPVTLELVDYRGLRSETRQDDSLSVRSTPARSPSAMRSLTKRVTEGAPRVIVASGDCFVGSYAWRLARRVGAHFVFDVYDDYRKFGAYRLFAGFKAYEFLVRQASLVLYAGLTLARQQVAATPWMLAPNGIDPALFRSMPQSEARGTTGLKDNGTRWVGYFGGMEAERGPADLVDAVGRLHATDASIRLVLCGPETGDTALRAPWVEHRGLVPHSSIPHYINACDVVVLPYRRGPIIDMASSCKIAEYLYCKRPVVATRTPNLLDNFARQASELGDAICNPGDPADLARAIDAQLRRPVVASLPIEHTWQHIATRTLQRLKTLS